MAANVDTNSLNKICPEVQELISIGLSSVEFPLSGLHLVPSSLRPIMVARQNLLMKVKSGRKRNERERYEKSLRKVCPCID